MTRWRRSPAGGGAWYARLVSEAPLNIPALREVLESVAPLRLGVLFGSYATGRAREDSDVDVAIWPREDLTLDAELRLAAELSSAAGREVDLVRLDRADADPLLAHEIARVGVMLVEHRPGDFKAFRANAISNWLDFDETVSPHRTRYLERLRQRGTTP